MNLDKLKEDIDSELYPSSHIFNFIHHFAFELEQTPQGNFGAHVKTANGVFSYSNFWEEIQTAITMVVYGDKYQEKIDDIKTSKNMAENTASNQIFNSALSHFQQRNNQGKMGEVLLFFMMEKLFNAVRLGSKFQLTMPKDQQMGNDATHIGIIEENGKSYPCFYLGEAKFYVKFDDAVNNALESLAAHRPNEKLKEELQWLRTTSAVHNSFKNIIDSLGSYDYKVRQVAFVIYKDDSSLPQDNMDQDAVQQHLEQEIQTLLENQLKTKATSNRLSNHPKNHEIHFVVFSLKDYQKAYQAFQDIFNVCLTTLNEVKNDTKTN